jgi:hypothetical protein
MWPAQLVLWLRAHRHLWPRDYNAIDISRDDAALADTTLFAPPGPTLPDGAPPGGDSAGANLALSALSHMRDTGRLPKPPLGTLLVSPCVDLSPTCILCRDNEPGAGSHDYLPKEKLSFGLPFFYAKVRPSGKACLPPPCAHAFGGRIASATGAAACTSKLRPVQAVAVPCGRPRAWRRRYTPQCGMTSPTPAQPNAGLSKPHLSSPPPLLPPCKTP